MAKLKHEMEKYTVMLPKEQLAGIRGFSIATDIPACVFVRRALDLYLDNFRDYNGELLAGAELRARLSEKVHGVHE